LDGACGIAATAGLPGGTQYFVGTLVRVDDAVCGSSSQGEDGADYWRSRLNSTQTSVPPVPPAPSKIQ